MDSFILQRVKDALLGARIIVCALSGGCDSIVLAYALKKCLDEGLIEGLYCAHFNHMLRGEDAKSDQRFCEKFCDSLGIEILTLEKDINAIAKAQKKTIEQAARDERYRFLYKAANAVKADFVALGHHQNDQAETMLLNLTRGSGLKGLCAMRERRGMLLRPLLSISREQIECFANENNLLYVTDKTNFDTDYSRNKIRILIKELESINSAFVQNASRASELLWQDECALCQLAESLIRDKKEGLHCNELLNAHKSISSRALRMYCAHLGLEADVESVHIDALLSLCKQPTGNALDLPKGFRARASYGLLKIEKRAEKFDFSSILLALGENITPYGSYFAELVEKKSKLGLNFPFELEVSPSLLGKAIIRARQAGDRISPLGMVGSKKLKDFYIDKKIDRAVRDLPIIAIDEKVMIVPDCAIAEGARIADKDDNILIVRWKGR